MLQIYGRVGDQSVSLSLDLVHDRTVRGARSSLDVWVK